MIVDGASRFSASLAEMSYGRFDGWFVRRDDRHTRWLQALPVARICADLERAATRHFLWWIPKRSLRAFLKKTFKFWVTAGSEIWVRSYVWANLHPRARARVLEPFWTARCSTRRRRWLMLSSHVCARFLLSCPSRVWTSSDGVVSWWSDDDLVRRGVEQRAPADGWRWVVHSLCAVLIAGFTLFGVLVSSKCWSSWRRLAEASILARCMSKRWRINHWRWRIDLKQRRVLTFREFCKDFFFEYRDSINTTSNKVCLTIWLFPSGCS